MDIKTGDSEMTVICIKKKITIKSGFSAATPIKNLIRKILKLHSVFNTEIPRVGFYIILRFRKKSFDVISNGIMNGKPLGKTLIQPTGTEVFIGSLFIEEVCE